MKLNRVGHFCLPLVGIVLAGVGWWYASTLVPDLPSPLKTWEESKLYVLEPFAKRGEMDQGIGLLAYYSLVRVARGFLLGIAIGTPLGLLLGLVVFQKSEPAALFAIAVCSMWPTVINTTVGVRAIPEDYWNVARVLRLSKLTTFTRII